MAVFRLNVDAEALTPVVDANMANAPVRTATRVVAKTTPVQGFGVVTLEATGTGLNTNNPTFTSVTMTSAKRGLLLEISGVSLSSREVFSDSVFLARNALGGDDLVITGPGDEVDLMTFAGSDRISSGGGNDRVDAGAGADIVNGGAGNDTLFGRLGADRIEGGGGRDRIDGGGGVDRLVGGAGGDNIRGGIGNDLILGGDGNDFLFGGGGADRVSGGAKNDRIDGGAGNDTLNGDGGGDTLNGGDGADILSGGRGAGFDLLQGGNGADTLIGGGGKDTLQGGGQNDVINGGGGDDIVSGGNGADRFVFQSRGGNDALKGFSEAEGDIIDLRLVAEITSIRDLRQNHFSQDGDDAVITLNDGSTIIIEDTRRIDLEANDFLF